jgi:hypothetical protein
MRVRSSRCSPRALALLAASSALLLSACTADKLASFSAGDVGLAVALPTECEAFLTRVPPPQVTTKTDARIAYTRSADALDEANDRLGGAADCSADQRRRYAGKDSK